MTAAAGLNINISANAEAAVNALTEVERELLRLGTTAQAAGAEAQAGLNKAFSTVGVRSEQAIKAEIDAITNALHTMAASGQLSGAELQRAFVAAGQKIEVLHNELKPIAPALDEIKPAAISMGAVLAAAFVVDKIAKLAVEVDNLSRSFKVITGDAQSAAEEMEFVSRTAMKLGLDISSVGNNWRDFSAATQGTVLAGQQARTVFEAVAGALTQMGKSSSEADAALKSLTAMVNTGVVSMDALKAQFGVALPAALKAAADNLGITKDELVKLIASGKALTVDVLPALAEGLKKATQNNGEITGLTQEWNLLTNAAKLTVEAFTQNEIVMKTAGVVMEGLRITLGGLGVVAMTVSGGILYVADAIGTLAAVAATPLKLNDALEDLSKKGVQFDKNISKLIESLGLAKPPTDALADAHNKLGGELGKGVTAAAALTEEQKKQAAASGQAKESTAALVVHTEQANTSFKNLTDAIRATTDIQKTHDQTAVSAIAIAGQQKAVLQAEATAAGHAAEAAQTLVNIKSASLTVAQRYLDSLQQEVAGMQNVDVKLQERIKLAGEDVDKKTLEVSASKAFAEAQALTAEKTTLATQTIKDNSARVGELKSAYSGATQALETANKLHDAGKISSAAYAEAVKNQRDALALYKDALNDAVTALKLKEAAEARHTNLVSQGIGVQIEAAKASQAAARARGDEADVIKQGLAIKELEVRQSYAVADGKAKEAAAAQASGNARIAEIKSAGELTTEMKAEIAQIEDIVKSKKLEADSAKSVAEANNAEAESAKKAAEAEQAAADAAKKAAESLQQASHVTHTASVDMDTLAKNAGVASDRMALFSQKWQEANNADKSQDFVINAAQVVESLNARWTRAAAAAGGYIARLDQVGRLTEQIGIASSGAGGDLAELVTQAEAVANSTSELNKNELSGLRSAIASAKQQMESLKDSADSTLSSLQQELAQMNGNYVKAEELRIASRKADLESQLAIARAQNNVAAESALSQAIATLDQIATIKIAAARQQEADALTQANQSSQQAASAAQQLNTATVNAGAAAQSAAAQINAATQQTATVTAANQAANQSATTQLTTATQAATTAANALTNVASASVTIGGAAQNLEQAASLLSSSVSSSANRPAPSSLGVSSTQRDNSSGSERTSSETGRGEVQSSDNGASKPEKRQSNDNASNADNSSSSSGNSPAPAPNYTTHINIAGVLDLNDRATLESLTRKLSPILSDLMRKNA